jgi:hypothetical protein
LENGFNVFISKKLICGEFFPFSEKYFEKEYAIKISVKFLILKANFKIKITQNHCNCLQYEKVLKIVYFHILNNTKLYKIYLWMISISIASPN